MRAVAHTEPELHGEIHGYVARRLGPSLAEDVVSGTFLIAFDRRRS